MPLCITDSDSRLSSAERDSELEASSMEQLSQLSISFRALNLLDASLNLVAKAFSSSGAEPEPKLKPKPIARGNEVDQWDQSEKNERVLPILSLDEIAWHDTIDDCWLVIYDYVYDCTNFLGNHPGGQDVLLEYAGRDATLAFIGTGHSKGANKILDKFLIGELPVSERIFRTPNGIKIGDFV